MIKQRELVLNILQDIYRDHSFANLKMRTALNVLPKEKRGLVSELVYGVLRNYDYLLFQAKERINNKTRLRNRLIIALALYERFFLKEKDYVVNNEYTSLAVNQYDKNFINAILNNVTELKKAPEYIENSLPEWIYNLLKKQYSSEEFAAILNNYRRKVRICYHINHSKAGFDDLRHLDIEVINEDCFYSPHNLIDTEEFKNGLFYIQDVNSAKLILPLELKKGETFLDACSAPGSKLFNAMDYGVRAHSNDLSEKRVELIRKQAEILGFKDITYSALDASKLSFNYAFDKILLDVPCSGLGVISNRPDIKINITPQSLDELRLIQAAILDNISGYLKKGGRMVYSTCTLNKKENSRQIDDFLKRNSLFKRLKEETIISDEGDCFFYCLLERI